MIPTCLLSVRGRSRDAAVETEMKGSHVTLYFGERVAVVRNPKDELKTGTLHAVCKQLGIGKDEL